MTLHQGSKLCMILGQIHVFPGRKEEMLHIICPHAFPVNTRPGNAFHRGGKLCQKVSLMYMRYDVKVFVIYRSVFIKGRRKVRLGIKKILYGSMGTLYRLFTLGHYHVGTPHGRFDKGFKKILINAKFNLFTLQR